MLPINLLLCLALAAAPADKAHVTYTLRVDTTDLTTFAVTMQVMGAPREFTIAANAHPEYDDKYWRYLEGIAIENGTIDRVDSVRWRVVTTSRDATISYRIGPPAAEGLRAAWRAFLAPTGGLVGGPHSFLYMVGAEEAPARVTLDIPHGWRVATGLERTNQRNTYSARNVAELMDSPIMIGSRMSESRFVVKNVPHTIVYWGITNGIAFDTAAFTAGVETLVREMIDFWGSMPYQHYTFIFVDGAYGGGLEHRNSVTLGASSADLARDPHHIIRETAHEFFHTWNLMRIRPAEYRDVDHRVQPPVPSLWFSEGLTIFYADLLRRRAGLPVTHPTRAQHLASLIARFLTNSGNSRYSAEQISRVEYNAAPGALGDFDGSSHLHGELIGFMLDIIIRGATDGDRSMDDVMRLMLQRASPRGFRGEDIERAVEDVCGCDVTPFFDAHVRGAGTIDFARYLALIGLRPVITREPARAQDGQPLVDLRIRAWQAAPDDTLKLTFWDPNAVWVKSGLHTNDRLININGQRVRTWADVRGLIGPLKIGDAVRFEIVRDGVPMTIDVKASGYDIASVRVAEIEGMTDRQKRLRAAWTPDR